MVCDSNATAIVFDDKNEMRLQDVKRALITVKFANSLYTKALTAFKSLRYSTHYCNNNLVFNNIASTLATLTNIRGIQRLNLHQIYRCTIQQTGC